MTTPNDLVEVAMLKQDFKGFSSTLISGQSVRHHAVLW
jgi:hypothetical protein